MCKKRNSNEVSIYRKVSEHRANLYKKIKADSCMANLIHILNMRNIKTVACCCGHGKYNMSIIYESNNGRIWDLVSGIEVHRKKRFYKKDKEGFYYIPEVVEGLK